jgi:hypothetical protein
MKKFVKFLVWTSIILAGLVAAIVIFLSPIASNAVKVASPQILGTEASLKSLTFNPFTGKVCLRELHVQNPVANGFSSNDCFSVSKIFVDLDIMSLATDRIHIEKIEIVSPKIRFELKGFDSNLAALTANIEKNAPAEKPQPIAKEPSAEKPKSNKRVIIDEVILDGAKVEMATILTAGAAVPIALPKIQVRDIGKDDNGASITEAVSKILNAVVGAVVKIASESMAGADAAFKALSKGGASAVDGAKNLGKGAVESVGDGAKAVGDALKSLLGK